jgi:hypothetical protein
MLTAHLHPFVTFLPPAQITCFPESGMNDIVVLFWRKDLNFYAMLIASKTPVNVRDGTIFQ